MAVSREEQRKAEAALARKRYEEKDSGGFSGKQAIDWAVIGGFKKEHYYRPKEGVNRIDIVPYLVTTNKHPYKVEQGYTDHLLEIWVHRRVGPSSGTFLCLTKYNGTACPICEEREALKGKPGVSDDTITAMYPKKRCWYNVINLDLPEEKQDIMIFEEAYNLFEKEILAKAGFKKDGFVTYWDLEQGMSVLFNATQMNSKKGKYFSYRIEEFERRAPYKDTILKETYPLDAMLIVPTYDEVRNAHLGIAAGEEEAEQEVGREEAPQSSRRERTAESEVQNDRRSRRESPTAADVTRSSRRRDPAPEPAQEPPKESRRSRREQSAETTTRNNSCPYNYRFGMDTDEKQECSKCDQEVFNACDDERERLSKQ
jgi:hypothetical protein